MNKNKNKSFSNMTKAVKNCLESLKPRPDLSLTEWAENSFFISKERSSRPGFYSAENAPYQREMVDITLDENIQYVTYMLSAQSGKNMCQELILGYHIEHAPCNVMYVMPNERDAKNLIDDGGWEIISQALESNDPGQIIGQFLMQLVAQMTENLPEGVDIDPAIYLAIGGWVEQISDYLQEEYDVSKEVMDRAEMYIGTASQQMAQGQQQQQMQMEQATPMPQQTGGLM